MIQGFEFKLDVIKLSNVRKYYGIIKQLISLAILMFKYDYFKTFGKFKLLKITLTSSISVKITPSIWDVKIATYSNKYTVEKMCL